MSHPKGGEGDSNTIDMELAKVLKAGQIEFTVYRQAVMNMPYYVTVNYSKMRGKTVADNSVDGLIMVNRPF